MQKLPGVNAFFDKNSIPGKNTFTPLEGSLWSAKPVEEEVFCSGTVQYYSQPIGIIVAESHDVAQEASELVEVAYKVTLYKPILTISDALNSNDEKRILQDRIDEPKIRGN